MYSYIPTYLAVSESPTPLLIFYLRHILLEWASGDLGAVLEWDYGTSDGVAYHSFNRQTQTEITESNNMANWGTFYWSTADVDGVRD